VNLKMVAKIIFSFKIYLFKLPEILCFSFIVIIGQSLKQNFLFFYFFIFLEVFYWRKWMIDGNRIFLLTSVTLHPNYNFFFVFFCIVIAIHHEYNMFPLLCLYGGFKFTDFSILLYSSELQQILNKKKIYQNIRLDTWWFVPWPRWCVSTCFEELHVCFCCTLVTFVFLDAWKLLFVTTIFESGRRNDVANYRGDAVLSAIPKFFELLVYLGMYEDLKNLISAEQHSLVKGWSTVSNFFEYSSCVLHAVENSCQIDSGDTNSTKILSVNKNDSEHWADCWDRIFLEESS
jgi:hypothetical protein